MSQKEEKILHLDTASPIETHDFMNVSSFSQLPFIRPTQTKDKPPSSSSATAPAAAIRLFGIDVPHDHTIATTTTITAAAATTSHGISRKFDCHYCGRSFPTSQALGGHQNAHKRERKHAQRAQLQSAMATAHHRTSPFEHHHIYHNFSPFSTSRFSSFLSNGYQYSNYSPPIHGSPLPPLWRARAPVRAEIRPLIPFFGGDGDSSSSTISSISPQNRLVCETVDGGKENVSLDLHL
ncbi:zinc finger protein 8-like [Phalaenopsis equestris]|uniref:zinc finger protein 8-like n=1 Tax=Phalaenopsis equestris TaxID=78828 RepID=UPI0009E4A7D6|nr:zinc finger protein 8-like [Phalaenopsis equestris]